MRQPWWLSLDKVWIIKSLLSSSGKESRDCRPNVPELHYQWLTLGRNSNPVWSSEAAKYVHDPELIRQFHRCFPEKPWPTKLPEPHPALPEESVAEGLNLPLGTHQKGGWAVDDAQPFISGLHARRGGEKEVKGWRERGNQARIPM